MPGANPAVGLAILRVAIGLVFLMHGYPKFFQFGIAGTTGFFTQGGIPLPAVAAPLVATVELVGGAAVILGYWHRIAAALQVCVMLGAIAFVKGYGSFFAPTGFEFELTLMLGALAIAIGGGGAGTLKKS